MTSESNPASHVYPHHLKVGPCYTRPPYRDGRQKKAVKVYTIATESTYVLICGVPSIKLEQVLKDKCKQYGRVELIRKLPDYPQQAEFTETFLVKFDSVQTARRAKHCLDDSSFYGGHVHVCYAPEYETVAECRVKLHQCRRDNARIARKFEYEYAKRLAEPVSVDTEKTRESSSVVTVPESAPTTSAPSSFSHAGDRPEELCSSEISVQVSGDPIDDARRYWSDKGADFTKFPPFPICPVDSSQGTVRQSRETAPSKPCPHKPVPLPVLQALSWKPYQNPLTETDTTDHDAPSVPACPVKKQPRPSLVPRCIQTRKHHIPLQPGTSQSSRLSTLKPLREPALDAAGIGELERLAFTLGPEQGPQAFGPENERCAVKRKRQAYSLFQIDLIRSHFRQSWVCFLFATIFHSVFVDFCTKLLF
ncbi:unnamed protein product [Calicophoron daubneyi]|uniref:RNA-binding protein 48 n=1 Tax=Calicophoron daubneyi TaxID=300641 RepID=A0AAV2T6X5_CALDB